FSFPRETHQPLLSVRSAGGPRAFSINAMQMNVAHALIRRAWIGQAPPRWIELRNSYEGPPRPADVVEQVCKAAAEAVKCKSDQANWLVSSLKAPFILIFATQPTPPPDYISELLQRLPSAILFFLAGSHEGPDRPSREDVIALPALKEGADFEFLRAFTALTEAMTVRDSSRHEESSRARSYPIRKKAGAKPKKK